MQARQPIRSQRSVQIVAASDRFGSEQRSRRVKDSICILLRKYILAYGYRYKLRENRGEIRK